MSPARLRPIAAVFALALLSSPAAAQPDFTPHSPKTALIGLGMSLPHDTLRIGIGVHGWWRDYLDWGVRVQGNWTASDTDLSGDGIADYDPADDGPNFEASFDIGVPLQWKMITGIAIIQYGFETQATTDVGTVTQMSLISGARVALSGAHDVGIPVGLRWSRHTVLPLGYGDEYRESWFQIRGLMFNTGHLGVDAEASWMPMRWIALVAYAEIIPALHDAPEDRSCTIRFGTQTCKADYPVNSFNPIAEQTYTQMGLLVRITAAR